MKKNRFVLLIAALVMAVVVMASCGGGAPDAHPVPASPAGGWDIHHLEVPVAAVDESARVMFGGQTPPPPPAAQAYGGRLEANFSPDMPMAADRDGIQTDWEDLAETGERHIIQTANVNLESDYFDDVVAELRQIAPSVGGYISSELLTSHGRRMFTIVLRVPAGTFESVLLTIQNLAEVRLFNTRADDVTDRFYDLAGNLEARRIEEERLLALIDAATSVTDILALETRLSDTRLIIERYLSQLNMMAGQIAYSTIYVQLIDTAEDITPLALTSVGERIGGAFGGSVDNTINTFQNIVVFFAGAIIPLAFLGLLGFAVFVIARAVHRRRKARLI